MLRTPSCGARRAWLSARYVTPFALLASTALTGCPGFGDEYDTGTETWAVEVADIWQESCCDCHNDPPTQAAPLPLDTYDRNIAVAADIRDRVVDKGDMPPGAPLSGVDRAAVERWLNSGGALGGGVAGDESICGTPAPMPDAGPPEDVGVLPDVGADGAPTWDAQIGPVLVATCATQFCHDATTAQQMVDLSSYAGWEAARERLDGGGDIEQSLMVQRINGIGGPMPPPPNPALSRAQITLVEDWIEAGAPEN